MSAIMLLCDNIHLDIGVEYNTYSFLNYCVVISNNVYVQKYS